MCSVHQLLSISFECDVLTVLFWWLPFDRAAIEPTSSAPSKPSLKWRLSLLDMSGFHRPTCDRSPGRQANDSFSVKFHMLCYDFTWVFRVVTTPPRKLQSVWGWTRTQSNTKTTATAATHICQRVRRVDIKMDNEWSCNKRLPVKCITKERALTGCRWTSLLSDWDKSVLKQTSWHK